MRHTRIIVTRYGGPDALRVVEEECPEPKDGEVRVRVLAAGVSLPDLLMREGVHPETPPLPCVIAIKESPSSGCILLAAGFSRAGNGWSPTASSGLNG